jgi:hypothetical protein
MRALRRSGDREDRAINLLLEVCHHHDHTCTSYTHVFVPARETRHGLLCLFAKSALFVC